MRRCQLQNSLSIESVVGKYGQNLEYPRSPRTKLLKGCCSFTPGMVSTFQVLLYIYIVSHGISFYITLTISLRFEWLLPLGRWVNQFWSSGPDYLEPLWGWARKRERMLGTCTTSRGRKSSFYVFHSPGGVSTDVVRGVRILWRWITVNHWWLMFDDDDDDDEDRIWVLPNVWLVGFKFFKYHHMELALCCGPVWEDILTGKWAHFQLGTGNEKKPRQTESKSKQIPMRPGWGSRLHRFEPNGGF